MTGSLYSRIKVCPEHGEMKWGKEAGQWVAHNWGYDYKQGRCVAAKTKGVEARRPRHNEQECGWVP